MNPLAIEWIQKAEGDFYTAQREIRVRVKPNYDGVCFNSQQVVEKYLKAYLQEHSKPFPKTHSLLDLLNLCIQIDGSFIFIKHDLNKLEGFAVHYRYPGETAEKSDAQAAFRIARSARKFIRDRLSFDSN